MAENQRALAGRARQRPGAAQAVDGQAADRHRCAALSGNQVPRRRVGSRQRRGMTSWRGWLLAAVTVGLGLAAFIVPAMPQPLSYHAFADCRTFWAVPNFFNVISNLPFLVGGAAGLVLIWRGGGQFVDAREQLPYLVFFLGALLTCFGSAWYHAAPDNTRLVFDRLPMTLGFSGLVAASVAERVDLKLGLRSLWPLLLVGVI